MPRLVLFHLFEDGKDDPIFVSYSYEEMYEYVRSIRLVTSDSCILDHYAIIVSKEYSLNSFMFM